MSGNRLVFIIIFLVVFVMMMTIGLLSGVSIGAGFTRALWAAAFFTAISLGTSVIIARYVIDDIKPTGNGDDEGNNLPENENLGQMLDIMVSEPPLETEEPAPETSDTKDETPVKQSLGPLVTRQIDPNVEKVINSDPRRMADIIKKMGFE
ncbi:MAG TPA: hypothetical protein VNT57_04765, partial [Desulfobacteria bacterium]|nr:hypothetical protein [Desulfobacteria bacterium]